MCGFHIKGWIKAPVISMSDTRTAQSEVRLIKGAVIGVCPAHPVQFNVQIDISKPFVGFGAEIPV